MKNFIVTFSFKDRERGEGWVLLKNVKDLTHAVNFANTNLKEFVHIYEPENFHDGVFRKGCIEEYDLQDYTT